MADHVQIPDDPGENFAQLQQRVRDLEQALLRERRVVAAHKKLSEDAVWEARQRPTKEQVAAAEKEIGRLERRLATVYSSRTWRAGRLLWRLFHLPRSILRGERPDQAEAARLPVSGAESRPQPRPIDYTLVENTIVRQKYEAALARRGFSTSDTGRNIVMAVYTTDLDEGRGDLFTAIGLGRHLEKIGYQVVYLPRDKWYELPRNTDLYVALLETVDLSQIPEAVMTIAWVRNQTEAWAHQPWLPWYDLVLCSSQESKDVLEQVYAGPTGLLPIGVDGELFNRRNRAIDREGVVSTVNQWGRERQLFTTLEQGEPDFPLALFGIQRGMSPQLAPLSRKPVSFFALPSLYNEARVVLDDFNHTTAGYGNINSRVFEAAACGAIVVTNRPIRLPELDAPAVTTYNSTIELYDLIRTGLDSMEVAKTADERSQGVLEEHSYEVRAAQFHETVGRSDDVDAERVVIGAFPAYVDNPYAEMMWSSLRSAGSIPLYVDDRLGFDPLLHAAENRPAIFHLNWTAPILGGGADDGERRARYTAFLEAIDELARRGVPTIWTVHNVLPHECADPDLEAKLRQELADRVDVVHVMCDRTVAECAGVFEIPPGKVRVIPHPSYIDVYPNLVDQQTARYELGLGHDDFVYLYLGQVRPYKGVDLLLDAFDPIARSQPKARLLLVGKSGRFPEILEIKQRARAHPQVISNFNEVPDGDIQLYMNAADVVVLPYRTGLNSGMLQLAYSFAKPVVVPAIGCLGDQVDEMTGVSFNWEDGHQALTNAMLAARWLGPEHGKAAYERAQKHHYLELSNRFADVARDLLAQAPTETNL
jgi:glycosyltransferase involved in cell wall biosynthesis